MILHISPHKLWMIILGIHSDHCVELIDTSPKAQTDHNFEFEWSRIKRASLTIDLVRILTLNDQMADLLWPMGRSRLDESTGENKSQFRL